MRVVILTSSVYSETACAMCARLSQAGYVPAGILALRSLHRKTLFRKVGQLGLHGVAAYGHAKLLRAQGQARAQNPYLKGLLENGGKVFRSLREVASVYGFPVVCCDDQNSPQSIARLERWSPDLMVFAGGYILRRPLLDVPRLGVLNAHLGLLPEIRGMSSPEWSLLNGVPVGVTVHYIDEGIDTGPILQRCELPDDASYESLEELRNRLVAFGVDKMADVVTALDHESISAKPQSARDEDNQFFVMHERLRAFAAHRLGKTSVHPIGATVHG